MYLYSRAGGLCILLSKVRIRRGTFLFHYLSNPRDLAGFLYDVYTLNMRIFFNDSSPTTSNSISHKTSTIKPTNRNQIHSLTKPQQSRHVEVLLTDENRQLKPQHKRRA